MMTPIEKVHDRLSDCSLKRSGDSGKQWVACCPAHDDNHQSLAVAVTGEGRVLLKCYAGCKTEAILAAIGLSFNDLFDQDATKPTPKPRITVAQLAWDKRLPVEFLKSLGLSNADDGGVDIAYLDERKHRVATRYRTALTAKEGSKWATGDKPVPYGLWRLADVKDGKLAIVEGESDAWTLWHHGYAALGLPGADMTKKIEPSHLANVKELYVWQEPGQGGETFVNGIALRLKELRWEGAAKIINGGPTKDPNALHQANPEAFKAKFDAILTSGKPMPAGVKEKEKKKKEKPRVPLPNVIPTLKEQWKSRPIPDAGYLPLTDSGNAERLVFRHGENIRYCNKWRSWLIWDGCRWKRDESEEIERLALETVRTIHAEAMDASLPKDQVTAITDWALRSESKMSLDAMIGKARSKMVGDVFVPVSTDMLDVDPWLFNCKSGTVDLKTGKLRPSSRPDYLTKASPVEFDPKAKCETWLTFLSSIMDGKQELVDFLQLAVGYSLTGIVSEKCFFFLYGDGNNGKSTFIEALETLFGDYQGKTTAETILDNRRGGSVPNDLACLAGLRFVSTAELPEGRSLDEARVKDLTGRDTISARFMRAEWFSFRPAFKLWMYGNHRPTIRGADGAIWERVRLIPFVVTFTKAQQDRTLPNKLTAEMPGILNWAIEGCLKWQKQGLPIPLDVQKATDDYRSEMDLIEAFINERCYHDKTSAIPGFPVTAIYHAYETWCKNNGERPVTQRVFSGNLKRKGYKQKQMTGGARHWLGLTEVADSAAATAAGSSDGRSDGDKYDLKNFER